VYINPILRPRVTSNKQCFAVAYKICNRGERLDYNVINSVNGDYEFAYVRRSIDIELYYHPNHRKTSY
jgi:hypothetical protein